MSEEKRRRFSREFKLRVIERLEAGESGTALGLELSIKRTIIYRWRDQWRQGGQRRCVASRGLEPRQRRWSWSGRAG